jgi:curved DNA-binding protein CbpA
MPVKNYYSILGVAQNATPPEIRRAYRKLVFRYHPDHNRGGIAGEERFREIKEAWEVLSDPIKRRHHDATLRSFHVYAPSYDFGKYTSPQRPDTNAKPEPIPTPIIKEDPLWLRVMKPVIFALIAFLLTWLIMDPPAWMKEWLGK